MPVSLIRTARSGAIAEAEELAMSLMALAVLAGRRLRGPDSRHWLRTAVGRTFLPFAVAAVVAAWIGWAMTLYAPEASSIGDVLLHAKDAL